MWTGAGYDAATISIIYQDLHPLHDHGDRRDLGKGRVRPVPLRARLLLGGRVQLRVIALHLPMYGRCSPGRWPHDQQMWIALAAYAAYVINAGQFLWKLRVARLEAEATA
jgi:3-vinyl bacteriochlorophyllide hydratase